MAIQRQILTIVICLCLSIGFCYSTTNPDAQIEVNLQGSYSCTPGCQSCTSFGCSLCLDGFYLETNLQCVKCPQKECKTCASNGCLSCFENNFLYIYDCIPCQQRNCPTCNDYGCTSCYDGFYLKVGVCQLCQEHCKSCNAFGCMTCKDGYYWDGKICTLRCNVPNCQACDRDGDCVVCQVGYTLKDYKCFINNHFMSE